MATAWIVIATTDLDDYLVGAQASAVRTAALAAGQSDTFASVMNDVALRIRSKISSCSTAQISATAQTIPPELKWAGVMLLIETLSGRIPSIKLTDDQKAMLSRAYTALDRVADCKDEVSTPLDPETPDVQRNSAVEVATSSTRTRTHALMKGL
jgi:hypothetical protein